MKFGEAMAEILKREGVALGIGYPVNHVLERAAITDIRTIVVRQERTGLHMADAIVSTKKCRATDISGDYAAFAHAFGGYGERVTDPVEITVAIRRGVAATLDGRPELLEFITAKELAASRCAVGKGGFP